MPLVDSGAPIEPLNLPPARCDSVIGGVFVGGAGCGQPTGKLDLLGQWNRQFRYQHGSCGCRRGGGVAESLETGIEERIALALVEEGILSQEQLQRARRLSEAEGSLLLETLVTLGLVARGVLLTMTGLLLRVPVEDLRNVKVTLDAVQVVPAELARECHVLPLALEADGSLRLAVSYNYERQMIRRLSGIIRRRLRVVIGIGGDIDELIGQIYQSSAPDMVHSEPLVFEGTASIRTQDTSNLLTMVDFVQRLRGTPQLRVLRLIRQASSYVDIRLGLREPLDLKDLLERITGVAEVALNPSPNQNGSEPMLLVRLEE